MATTQGDVKLTEAVVSAGREIWLAGLGAFAKAQEEGGKVYEALVRQGREIEAQTRAFAGGGVEGLTSRVTGTFDKLEQVFEKRVEGALKRIGVPTAKDVDKLSKRVHELDTHVSALLGRSPKAKRLPKARKARR